MPRNGAGVFSLVNNTWFPPVNGVLATATDWTPFITDVQNALTQSVSSDGQTPFTGNLPMGNNKITGLANGTATTDAAAFGQVSHYVGNCRLTKSGSNLLLIPFNGNQLTINGALQTIPAAGVSLAPGAAVALTLYYIYAFMVGAVMTLEFSTTAHSTDVTTGVEIKTGDVTRTLVGMARPIAGPAWQDVNTQRFVSSWFNRRPLQLLAVLGANQGTTSTTYIELISSMRAEFLAWLADPVVNASFDGSAVLSTTAVVMSTTIAVSGSTGFESWSAVSSPSASAFNNPSCSFSSQVSEGYNYLSPFVRSSNGDLCTYQGGGAPSQRCSLKGSVNG